MVCPMTIPLPDGPRNCGQISAAWVNQAGTKQMSEKTARRMGMKSTWIVKWGEMASRACSQASTLKGGGVEP